MSLAIPSEAKSLDHSFLAGHPEFWAARLGAKILREQAKGSTSLWHGYLNALPRELQTPSLRWSQDTLKRLHDDKAAAHLQEAIDMVQWASTQLDGSAIGKAATDSTESADTERFMCATNPVLIQAATCCVALDGLFLGQFECFVIAALQTILAMLFASSIAPH